MLYRTRVVSGWPAKTCSQGKTINREDAGDGKQFVFQLRFCSDGKWTKFQWKRGCWFEFHVLVVGSQKCIDSTRSLDRCGPKGWAQLLCRDAADKRALQLWQIEVNLANLIYLTLSLLNAYWDIWDWNGLKQVSQMRVCEFCFYNFSFLGQAKSFLYFQTIVTSIVI